MIVDTSALLAYFDANEPRMPTCQLDSPMHRSWSELAREGLRARVDRGITVDSFLGLEPIAPGAALVTNQLVAQLLDEDGLPAPAM